MALTSDYIQITYMLLAGLIGSLAWIFSLKRDQAVLQNTVMIHKENQDAINLKHDKEMEKIDSKLNEILNVLLAKNGNK
jgi:hypothetical protein